MARAEQGPKQNRAWQRRIHSGVQTPRSPELQHQIIDIEVVTTDQALYRLKAKYNNQFTSMVYNGPPVIVNWVKARKDHARITKERLGRIKNHPLGMRQVYGADNDLFTKKIKGISLAEIDEMSLPLSQKDIKRIDGLFFIMKFGRKNPENTVVGESLAYLATVSLAQRSGAEQIPASVKHLKDVSQDFFDYYVRFLRDGPPSFRSSLHMAYFFGRSRDFLMVALAAYMPARLGISPASARKLYEQRGRLSNRESVWAKIGKSFFNEVKSAIPKSVDEDLKPYLSYGFENDSKAAEAILNGLGKNRSTTFDDRDNLEDYKKDFMAKTRHPLSLAISIGQGRFTYKPLDGGAIEKVTAITPYPNSTIFILEMNNGSHLTIELGEDGFIYGIPQSLYEKCPHIEELLLPNILKIPLPERALKIHPKPAPDSSFVLKENVPEEVAAESQDRTPKRRILNRGIPTKLNEPEVPETSQPSRRFVEFSEEQLRDLLEGRKTDPNLIAKALSMISRFERGWKQPMPMHTDEKDPRVLCRLRSGDIRVVLEDLGTNRFRLVAAGERKGVYRGI